MIYIRPASADDVEWVGAHLRKDDLRELMAVHLGGDPEMHVRRAYLASREVFAVFDTSRVVPLALFGALPDEQAEGMGIVWFLATPAIHHHPISILRETTRWLDHLSRVYPGGLHNLADSRNTLHLRWCRLVGFTIGDTHPVNGVPFHYIHRLNGATSLV